jgi:hypothetical protein
LPWQISPTAKAHHLVFLVFALFWFSAKETYPQDAHQQLQAGAVTLLGRLLFVLISMVSAIV